MCVSVHDIYKKVKRMCIRKIAKNENQFVILCTRPKMSDIYFGKYC